MTLIIAATKVLMTIMSIITYTSKVASGISLLASAL